MTPTYKPNISAIERWTSTMAGVGLAAVGLRRSNRMLELLGVGLVARGASGWCPASALMGRDSSTATHLTTQRLAGPRGVLVEAAITIHRPVSEIYSYWRNLENLPRFMLHLDKVHVIDRTRSHWVAKGPLGISVGWDAEIISDIPPALLSWKSVGQSDVVSAGSVRFRPVGERSTEIRVRLQYDPPAGKAGAKVAWLLGEDPQHQINEDLQRFKRLLESGAIGSIGARHRPASSERRRREMDGAERSGEWSPLR